MIKQIEIENFQSHARSIIDLDNGVNTFIGDTDAGKSAVARAVRWCFYNLPSGDKFTRYGQDYVSVKLTLDTGYCVTRYRKGNTNRYIIESPSGDTINYDNFGTGVPEDVQKVLGIAYFKEFEVEELNVAKQGKSNALLELSGSNKSKLFNLFSGLDSIDAGISSFRKDILSLNKEKKIIDSQLESVLKRKVVVDDYKEKIMPLLQFIETTLKELSGLNNKIVDAQDIISKMDKSAHELNLYYNAIFRIDNVLSGINKEFLKDYTEELQTIRNAEAALSNFQVYENREKMVQKHLDSIDTTKATLASVVEPYTAIIDNGALLDKFAVIDLTQLSNDGSIDIADKQQVALKAKYAKLLKDSGVCPTCNQNISEEYNYV